MYIQLTSSHLTHQQFLGKCPGSHVVTNIHLKLLKNVIQIFVMRLSIFLTSMDVIQMEIGLLVNFQQINQDGKILNRASFGNIFLIKSSHYINIIQFKLHEGKHWVR